jgi:hypothetical protein
MTKKEKKIYWYPAKLIEDPLTGEVYVLMYGGSGRVRFVRATEIQSPIWSENIFKENISKGV